MVTNTETDTKEYSDDFDTDSKSSDDGKAKMELLAGPADVVLTDSEVHMAVSDQDEPMMDLKMAENAIQASGVKMGENTIQASDVNVAHVTETAS